MLRINKYQLSALILCTCSNLQAGGPLVIEGSSGNTPVRYSPATVQLNFDIGTLGARSNLQADTLVLQAFALWNNVSTSDLLLQQGSDLSADIDLSNYTNLLPDTSNHPANSDNLNPVIYDDDGSIIDDMFGVNASDNIAGFAASVYFNNSDQFKEGYAVLNGKLVLTNNDIVSLVTHEIGHFTGLDHSQLDIDNTETDSGLPEMCDTQFQDQYPVMYPFLCRLESTLHADDKAAVSALYPTANITSSFGQINGVFVDTSDNPIMGANLWVTSTATGASYSIVSDYLLQVTGFFSIYLPAGAYTLHANSINSIFHTESSVGPYALTQSGLSFQSPHPITAVSFEGNTPGFEQSITINTGAGTHVKFVVDGSGVMSAGSIIKPPVSVPFTDSSSGGGISWPGLLLFTASLICFRRRTVTLAA